jgi:hypothetical protein
MPQEAAPFPGDQAPLVIGSDEHKRLFCKVFVDTHEPYEPESLAWPELDAESLQRLRSLPVWEEAARTEAATAFKVQALGEAETDPVLKDAISLQGYEEGRHAAIIRLLTKNYGIPVGEPPVKQSYPDPTWTFLRTGYGECLDSFFAFGLFAIGKRSQLFPAPLIDLFDGIMQEEARHILFIVNWAAYLRRNRPFLLRPAFDARRAWNIVAQAVDRARGAMDMKSGGDAGAPTQSGFTMKSHNAFGDFTPRSFLELCAAENARRLSRYDARLLRPALVPPLVKLALRFLPSPRAAEERSAA